MRNLREISGVLADELSGIVDAGEWLEEYGRVYYVLDREVVTEKNDMLYGEQTDEFLSPLSPSMNIRTQRMYLFLLTDLFVN